MSNKKNIAFEIPVHTDGKTPVAKPPPSIAKKMENGPLKRSLSSEDLQSKLNDAQQRKKQVLDTKVQKARQQVNKAKTYSAKTRETVEKVVKEKLAHLQGKLDRAVTVKYEQDKAKKEKIASHLNDVIKKKAAAMRAGKTVHPIEEKLEAAEKRRKQIEADQHKKLEEQADHAKKVRARKSNQ